MANSVDKVVQIANQEIGYLEKSWAAYNKDKNVVSSKTNGAGSDNVVKYWEIYPSFQGQSWCAAFVNWAFIKAYGEPAARKMLCVDSEWSFYTPTSAQYFKNKKQWYTSNPQLGDVIFFKNSTRIHHTGLVIQVDAKYVYTIEGNTSAGSQVIPNGGGVCAKAYSLSNSSIAGYGRPKYDAGPGGINVIPIVCYRSGMKITGAPSVAILDFPKTGNKVGSYKEGELVQFFGRYKTSDGINWLQSNKGFIDARYVTGWIQEQNKRWWYVKKGYKYSSATVEKIDGKYYCFDPNGWMIESGDIDSSGALKTM